MPEINRVGNRPLPPGGSEQSGTNRADAAQQNGALRGLNSGVGSESGLGPLQVPPAPLGQPGIPIPPGATKVVVPDVLTGRDPSQQVAGERLRTDGAPGTATEKLLGLDRQPTVVGAFPAPPGNAEALKHLSPAMRRAMLHSLLGKQRERMLRLGRLAERERDDEGGGEDQSHRERERRRDQDDAASGSEEAHRLLTTHGAENLLKAPDAAQMMRANREVKQVFRMLSAVERLLALQDYTLSQMGTFSKG